MNFLQSSLLTHLEVSSSGVSRLHALLSCPCSDWLCTWAQVIGIAPPRSISSQIHKLHFHTVGRKDELPPKWRRLTSLLHSEVNWKFCSSRLKNLNLHMFENGMDINIKCILWKKCLGFDQMHFGIIMRMFSVYKNWAEINSAIPCRGEIWSLFCPQGLWGTSLCVSYFWSKTPKNFANQIVSSKASFSLIVHIRSGARWHTCTHTHTHQRCGFSVWH